MANYGRGWGDGYGGQSEESINAYQDQQEIEAGQIQNARRQREREEELKLWRDKKQMAKWTLDNKDDAYLQELTTPFNRIRKTSR